MKYTETLGVLDQYLDDLINSKFAENPHEVKAVEKLKQKDFEWPRHNILLGLLTVIEDQQNKINKLEDDINYIRKYNDK